MRSRAGSARSQLFFVCTHACVYLLICIHLQYRKTSNKVFVFIFGLYNIAWFIVGNVWVSEPLASSCDEMVYKTAFWFIIATCIFLLC